MLLAAAHYGVRAENGEDFSWHDGFDALDLEAAKFESWDDASRASVDKTMANLFDAFIKDQCGRLGIIAVSIAREVMDALAPTQESYLAEVRARAGIKGCKDGDDDDDDKDSDDDDDDDSDDDDED